MKNKLFLAGLFFLNSFIMPLYGADRVLILALEKNGEDLLRLYTLDQKNSDNYKKITDTKIKTVAAISKKTSRTIKP